MNGVPTVASYFQAQTDQGTLQGIVAFYGHGGQTYQVLAYAPAQRFGAYETAFRQVVGSFAPLTDRAALAVQPNVIKVVKVDPAQSLGTFAQRSGSVLPVTELAIINQVEGAGTQLPKGALAKAVVPKAAR